MNQTAPLPLYDIIIDNYFETLFETLEDPNSPIDVDWVTGFESATQDPQNHERLAQVYKMRKKDIRAKITEINTADDKWKKADTRAYENMILLKIGGEDMIVPEQEMRRRNNLLELGKRLQAIVDSFGIINLKNIKNIFPDGIIPKNN